MANSRLSDRYAFEKPNDRRALDLMNAAAVEVLKDLPDLAIAYGVSDEYRFDLTNSRRILSSIPPVSSLSGGAPHYIYLWGNYFPDTPLQPPHLPSFDGRAVVYPTIRNLRDYMSWRQVDCHINNLYNTTFWMMVLKGGMSNTDAENELKGTLSSDKNEILFKRFGINYNNEEEIYKKGSVVYRQYQLEERKPLKAPEEEGPTVQESISKSQQEKLRKLRRKAQVIVEHVDIIKDEFWERRPWILSGKPGRLPAEA
ncbi:hypothetical protein AN0804.2 [Aspergillus nidulans FGSC A4]|nr:hypothetical protein AN0804.2 [Aspergillus nidulans FGSC A4]|eukprot:XP_658408.1 hypothetical protein AN0804.2 [Aspergillus nidulans FGSC A4]